MVKARRPATAGVSRTPNAAVGVAVATRSTSAVVVAPRDASPMHGTVKVRPLSAFQLKGTSSRSQLSWNDSAILHTEDSSPIANRRWAGGTASPITVRQVSRLQPEDVAEVCTTTPKYTSLKALPDQQLGRSTDILPGVVEDAAVDPTVGIRDEAELESPALRSLMLRSSHTEATQTCIDSKPMSTQTEFSVSLVNMIENALDAAVLPASSGRRASLPAEAEAPTAWTSIRDMHPMPPGLRAECSAQTDPLEGLDLARRSMSDIATQTLTSSPSVKRMIPAFVSVGPSSGSDQGPGAVQELATIGESLVRDMVVLTLSVIEAAELPQSKVYGLSDPYCIVSAEGATKRTKIVPSTQDPKWDSTFSFCLKSFASLVSLAVLDKHAAKNNKLMGVLEFVPGDLLAKVCESPEQHVVEADAWLLLQNRTGIPAGGRVLVRLATADFTMQEKLRATASALVPLESLAEDCLGKHCSAEGEQSPVGPAGPAPARPGKQESMKYSSGSYKSVTGEAGASAVVFEDPKDLIELFEGEKSLEEGVDEGYYTARSLFVFDKEGAFRQRVFKLVSGPVFHVVSWLMAAMACFAMGVEPQRVSAVASGWATAEFVSYAFLLVEVGLKSIAFGFADKSASFVFAAVWNVVDLVALLSYVVEYAMPAEAQTDFTLRPFRFFRLLSPLAQFEVFTGLTTIFLSLKDAFWGFSTVIAFLLLFFVGFGIFGVTFYHHSFSRRCVNAVTREIIIPNRGCKLFEDGSSSCNAAQACESIETNELGAVVNFDHITTAFVSIFQAISLDGMQDVMNQAIQSEPAYAALGVFFFLVLTFFCRFLLFNLCVAVITTTFQDVRKEVSAALAALHASDEGSGQGSQESMDGFTVNRESSSSSSPLSPDRGALTPNTLARRKRTQGAARRSLRDMILAVVGNPLFEIVAMSVVLVNTAAMARQAAGLGDAEMQLLSNLEVTTQCLFVVELLFRMLGANSLPEFFARGHDKFDFFVILLTGMCLFARLMGVSKERLGLLASFSALRFIRLVSVIPSINHLLTLTLASVTNIANLLFFTFAFFSVYAVCAVFIFGSNPDDIAAADYSDYWRAMRTLFAIFIGDDWRVQLYTAMQHGIETADWWRILMPCGFVVAFFFFSQAVLVNLYIAVIIENFSVATTQEVRHDPVMQGHVRQLRRFARASWDALRRLSSPFTVSSRVADIGVVRRVSSSASVSFLKAGFRRGPHDSAALSYPALSDHALLLFRPDHPLRAWCRRTAEGSPFQTIILSVIFLSMIALAVEPPTREIESPVDYAVLDAVNYISTCVFTAEFLIQAVNLGLLFTPNAYFRSAWNTVDFLVLVLSLVDIFGGNTKEARVLRLGRALRPLRLIKRNQGMRLMLDALLATWKPVSMIVILAFAVATIFAIMGMSLFKGRFASCTDASLQFPSGLQQCVGTFSDARGVLMPSAWVVPEENFDSFTRAMMQCLTMNTMQWTFLMEMSAAVTEPGKAMVEDGNVQNVLFLVIYLVIGGLFVTNLFVAFIIDGFNQLRKVDAKNLEKIANYDVFLSLVRRSSPHRKHWLPTRGWRAVIAKRVLPSATFQTATTLCVFLNVFFLALHYPGRMSAEAERLYALQNDVFLALMVLEAALIVAGKGWLNYLEDSWNWIDIVSIAATCVSYVFPESTFIRSFRLVKILRIIKNVKALQAMFETLARAIPQFNNVLLLLFLILSMFAILCVNLFGLVKEGPLRLGSVNEPWPSTRPTFKSYPVAMYTLFLITQGEEWNLLVYDTAVQAPSCTAQFEGKEYGDCGIPVFWSFLIFFAFKLVAEFVLINLFVGMIIDTFTATNSSHVAVQFHFEVGSSTQSVKSAPSAARNKRGSVVKASAGLKHSVSQKLSKLNSLRGGNRASTKRMSDSPSCADCWHRMTGGGRHDFILITDVQILMRMLPQPLGFARDALGLPTVTAYDRAICKLIWAELNILVLQRSEISRGWWQRALRTARSWLGVGLPVPTETGKVTFDETFLTLFHWRCPSLVPEEVRKQREPMLEEVVKTAHAVSISRHIRRWLAICRLRKQNKSEHGEASGNKGGAALMLMESRNSTQEEIERCLEQSTKSRLAEAQPKKKGVARSGSAGAEKIKKIHAAGAMQRKSLQSDDEPRKSVSSDAPSTLPGA